MKEVIVQEGAAVLRQKAKPVLKKDISSRKIAGVIERMKKTLAKEEFGVAIAAPQIGESWRIFVISGKVFDEENTPDRVFINPTLTRLSKKKLEMTEGCLSVRHKYGSVMRHERASIKALDEQGREFTYHGTGLVGHIFQHECDHLDGVLYIDKAVKLEDDKDWQKLGEKRKSERK